VQVKLLKFFNYSIFNGIKSGRLYMTVLFPAPGRITSLLHSKLTFLGAGAALRYVSGSTKIMWHLAASAP
jgi:hypothetical protein